MFALVDCNNFYVSCERVFNPACRNKPVVVLSNNDGCIISRSEEAKKLGIKMAEPAFKIKELIEKNKVAVFSSNYALYGNMSERVMNTIATLVKDMEIYSIDEVFLDMKGYANESLSDFAYRIRNRVFQWTGVPVSVGIGSTKTLAKIAAKIAKKNTGVFIFTESEKSDEILNKYPVEDIWGVGRQYAHFLKKFGYDTALKLKNSDDAFMKKYMKIVGLRTVYELRGIPCYKLQTHVPMKENICTARSFGKMTEDFETIAEATANYTATCARKLRKMKACASLITIFLQTNYFREDLGQYNNAKVLHIPVATNATNELIFYALSGLRLIYKKGYLYKKAGVIVSGISSENEQQLSLMGNEAHKTNEKLMKVFDAINEKMGKDKLRFAAQGFDRKWKLRQEKLSPNYTTKWEDILKISL
ncbi:MAG: SOS mutagenesis and repair protein UmuC [Bacteroidetes bacterium RIFOXYA12_FULL_35_11]|nr:MAG: SOS mutagenesis and repair protein UmuC [Bacteroidetes bacterium GWF2_35_48]OFY74766.1 MAG: SOS mutagenesis and repair protein UmuC [Bacteroidetes bacterium RIFOXYA12_FULL_35_11]OFY95142.1 MAG: SOS mutagenesis and repair protein UmuC [Bacteroidetes bacterium RIFOXYC12_FULL_35_7]OFY95368.1 MAG: SOS mutagenesis and repair protein UmuC [Bacteroidetes bacterium RIFOXYB2_FULL_35_7]HBX49463.1 SOS mutagenesis and repair protein UmuC [Bacteroidales bacterium]